MPTIPPIEPPDLPELPDLGDGEVPSPAMEWNPPPETGPPVLITYEKMREARSSS